MTFQKGDKVRLRNGVNPYGVYFDNPQQVLEVVHVEYLKSDVQGTEETLKQIVYNTYLEKVKEGS